MADQADSRMNDSGTVAENCQSRPGYLYRHWADDGALLYVGISLNAVARLAQHRGKVWFPLIAKVSVQRFGTYEEAERAELRAILREKPAHNATGPRTPEELDRALAKLRQSQSRASERRKIRNSRLYDAFVVDKAFDCIPAELTFEEYTADSKKWQAWSEKGRGG